ncbi:MAG TPA: hypothetical protein PK629_09625 [Oscillospiraceae bacterium]|nr:hypothetical protein [Oscillospiraceae bacterium]HPF56214.1 hypothetical protein [Clostridiales bacterium]HPK34936.1 hypothetical protein [Oscillospiraceae bacterium]HPR75355.1 hypothetical protein [Oscillospiraceae bacterium]
MKKLVVAVVILLFLAGCAPAVQHYEIKFQLKIADWTLTDYFICAEGQDIKHKIELEDFEFTEEVSGNVTLRTYDIALRYPVEVSTGEDGRSFWTLYAGYITESSEYFTYTLKNIGIRSGHTIVEVNILGGGKVIYDTIKTVYSDENHTLYVDEGMEHGDGNVLHDTQFIWYEQDGERVDCGSVLTDATVQLLGQNAPNTLGETETWFSVISGNEGLSEIDRFCVTIKAQKPQPDYTLTYADLPDVISEREVKRLAVSEFAADGIKPGTDVAAMKAVFGEPMSSWGEYEKTLNYQVYQYDGVKYTFRTGILGRDGWEEQNITYSAKFTKNLVEFPRGIKIGDNFTDVLKKFPQEMNYKEGENLFYGDYWTKYGLVGWGTVQIKHDIWFDNGAWIFITSDDIWPMLYIHFNEKLIADKITVQFSPYPYG